MQRGLGGLVGDLAGLEHAVFACEAQEGDGISGTESDRLLLGKARPAQRDYHLALFCRINRQIAGCGCVHHPGEGYPIVGHRLGLARAIALTLALPLAVTPPLPLLLPPALTLTLPLAVTPPLTLALSLTLPLALVREV